MFRILPTARKIYKRIRKLISPLDTCTLQGTIGLARTFYFFAGFDYYGKPRGVLYKAYTFLVSIYVLVFTSGFVNGILVAETISLRFNAILSGVANILVCSMSLWFHLKVHNSRVSQISLCWSTISRTFKRCSTGFHLLHTHTKTSVELEISA